jgi:hypothetical protein
MFKSEFAFISTSFMCDVEITTAGQETEAYGVKSVSNETLPAVVLLFGVVSYGNVLMEPGEHSALLQEYIYISYIDLLTLNQVGIRWTFH